MMKLLRTKKHQFIITMCSTYKGNVNTNRVQKKEKPHRLFCKAPPT